MEQQLSLLLASVIYILFGGSGDLATRYLIPGLYNLWLKGKLPPDFLIIGVGCNAWSDDDYRAQMTNSLKNLVDWHEFVKHLQFQYLNIDENDLPGYFELKRRLLEFELSHGPAKQIFFGALPPKYFGRAIEFMLMADMLNDPKKQVLLLEKPIATEMKEGLDLLEIIEKVPIPVLLNEHFAKKLMAKAMPQFIQEAPAEIIDLFHPSKIQICRAIANETISVPNNRVNFYNHCPATLDMHSHLLIAMQSQFIVSLNNRYSD